ncbi:PQQ-dependent sugar dehydrogenase [Luteolibacter sp. SL250]|uniref:PQQ-dependent sugar dehydrogenase n=1 Tax=Luteolibacter sp. SL250 TaxID=2995170 RepID=UPI00226F1C22|nr:PQQ-dependent sugar dehydrogenase [Luteolibacter sp. SL250]WAC19059.1 PQQ-dependent sugar dehydrogenase [Luteolibacter sp. SL250]
MKVTEINKLGQPLAVMLPMIMLGTLSWAQGEQPKPTIAKIEGNIFRPAKLQPTDAMMENLKIAEGFEITAVAEGLQAPRMLALAPGGGIYVTRRAPFNDVHLIRDADGDGVLEVKDRLVTLPDVHGIAVRDGKVYLAAIRDLYVADIAGDGTFSEMRKLCDDLPDAGQHPNRTIEFSPEGELFLSVGSTSNDAPEPNKESATMLKVSLDGKKREIYATGLRNTIGFAWHPINKRFYGMDHGIDWLGDDSQREELNELKPGLNYGWPFVFEDGKHNPSRDPAETTGKTRAEYAAECEAPVGTYTAHSAPMALLFPTAKFFADEVAGDGLVTLHGSWNRGTASGYEVVRVRLGKDGASATFHPFISGFFLENEKGQFGRPCDLIEDRDGSVLMSDDSGGRVYRIKRK